MGRFDYYTLLLYLMGMFSISAVTSRRISDHKDMFSAGRQSPWWAAGLSGFMTMFSAGTFVVWGGVAYRLGIVAIMINACYGIAALLVGYFVAGHWNRLGVTTPAEYVQLRFGKAGLHFFTWSMLFKRILGVSVSLYALGILLVALIPLSEGNPFRDAQTGTLSLSWAVIFFGTVVVLYTMQGGLWAVLMTDVVQFIVLMTVVLIVAVRMLLKMDGLSAYVESVPPDFFSPVAGGYGWLFLFGWVTIHFFMVGAEWAFVQRFLAVRSPSDARKSCYLFGALYLVSPAFWLLPPLLYRGVVADVNPEQAYILAAQSVLPPGLLGLMCAAMFSATASMVSSQLNVFAGVLTNDFYKPLINPGATGLTLVRVGRLFTVLLGLLLVTTALLVPYLGGAEKLIIAINSLLVVPLFAPTLWGLFSSRISIKGLFIVGLTSFTLGAVLRFGVIGNPWLVDLPIARTLLPWLTDNTKNVEVLVGVIMPVLLLCLWEARPSGVDPGWDAIERQRRLAEPTQTAAATSDRLPIRIVIASLLCCAVGLFVLAYQTQDGRATILAGGCILFCLAVGMHLSIRGTVNRHDSAPGTDDA